MVPVFVNPSCNWMAFSIRSYMRHCEKDGRGIWMEIWTELKGSVEQRRSSLPILSLVFPRPAPHIKNASVLFDASVAYVVPSSSFLHAEIQLPPSSLVSESTSFRCSPFILGSSDAHMPPTSFSSCIPPLCLFTSYSSLLGLPVLLPYNAVYGMHSM